VRTHKIEAPPGLPPCEARTKESEVPMPATSLAERTEDRARDMISRTTFGMRLVNREVHPRELTKGDSDA
jgi:hypothetical protein